MPGMGELLIILLIVLLIFGAGKLPAIGDALGRSIKNFKRTATGNDEIEVSTMSAPASIAFIRLTSVTPVVEWTWTWTSVSSPQAALIPRTISYAA